MGLQQVILKDLQHFFPSAVLILIYIVPQKEQSHRKYSVFLVLLIIFFLFLGKTLL